MKKYDLAVIGSGAGLMLVEAALQRGWKCAIIEKSKFGGTCLTKGCIPSKMLVYPADMIREAQAAGRVGLDFTEPQIHWDTISQRMWNQIDYSKMILENLKKTPGLDVYEGEGAFTGPGTMRVRLKDGEYSEEFAAERFVIAAGARSFIPPIDNLEQAGYVTAETFFGEKFPKTPWKRLVIVGGGAIGAEFAHIFSALGTRVTVVEMQKRLISTEEEEISAFVERQFTRNGIEVLTGFKALFAESGPGGKALVLEDASTGERRRVDADEIFISSGVRSNGDLLNLEKTGVATDERGWIKTDEYLETSQPGIYAIGDINGKYQFRHTANHEAVLLIGNLFGEDERKKMTYDAVPWAIFTWPQVAHVGMTQREAQAQGLRIGIARNRYSSIAGGVSMGISRQSEDDGFVKIILTRERKIVGAHIVGPYASMLVQPFVYLMNAGSPCECPQIPAITESGWKRKMRDTCLQIGSVRPILDSMVIHPSMNELTAWAIDEIQWLDGDEQGA
jgi:mycothione reductase